MYCMHLNEPVVKNINCRFSDDKACVIVAKTEKALVDYFKELGSFRQFGTPIETDFTRLAGYATWCGKVALIDDKEIFITHVFWAEDGKIEEIPQNT